MNIRKRITPHGVASPVPTPCPFCERPDLLDPPTKTKGKAEFYPVVPTVGRFWKRDEGGDVPTGGELRGAGLTPARRDGDRFITDIPAAWLAERFEGFTVRLVGVDSHWLTEPPPAPFANAILRANGGPGGVVWNPEYPLSRHTTFSGVLIERGGVRVKAHWWPSHGWRVEVHADLATAPAEDRNADLQAAADALEFFRLETRGGVKITDGALRLIFSRRRPPQTEVAELLGVTVRGLDKWRKKRGFESWRAMVEHFAQGPST